MSALDRELLVLRGFCGSRGDDDAIDEAENELKELRDRNAELERKLAEAKKELSSIDYIGDVSIGIKVLKNTLEASKEANEKSYESFKQMAKRAEQAEQRIAESRKQEPYGYNGEMPIYTAPIVPPTVEEAVKAEREACADIAKNWRRQHVLEECCDHAQHVACMEIEVSIRARGEKCV